MLWLTLLTAIFSSSYATENDHECQGGHNCNDDIDIDVTGGGATADSNSDSSSSSSSESASSSGASSDNNVTFNSTRPKNTTVRNVASPDTPNIYPSAPCRIARSAGLSLAGGAISGGHSVEDVECTLRETARTFQYLGVPEVGLVILCQNSVVINGRRDKKGNTVEGERPLGTEECLRLVREFQGDDNGSDAEDAVAAEIEVLREQQDRTESVLFARVEQLEQLATRAQQRPRVSLAKKEVAPVIIQQPYLNDDKRAKLAALLNDEEMTQ